MIKRLLLLLVLIASMTVVGLAQGTLRGTVTDAENKEPLPSAVIKITKNGQFKKGTAADFDGNYSLDLDPGDYDIEVVLLGYQAFKTTNITVENRIRDFNIKLVKDGIQLTEAIITATRVPLVKTDVTTQGGTLTATQMAKLPTRDVAAIAGSVAGVAVGVDGGNINVKGGRSEQTAYIIDGVRVRGTNTVPVSAIEQLEVITGGLEAQYGDFTGGGIVISTKSISDKISGSLDAETSTGLTPYGYNFLEGSFAAPLLKKERVDKYGGKYREPVIGIRMSGTYRSNLDPSPAAIPVYAVKSDVAAKLRENPVSYIGGGTPVAAAELLKSSDFDALKVRPNLGYKQLDLTSKIVVKLSKTMEFSVLGNYYAIRDKQNPVDGSGRSWRAFNSEFNPSDNTDRWRVNARLRQRFENEKIDTAKSKGLVIGGASYELIFGYEQGKKVYDDAQHGDKYFEYGHVGNFNYQSVPVFQQDTSLKFIHAGYLKQFTEYKPSSYNPILANYNKGADIANQQFNVVNGQVNANVRNVWDFHQNIGQVFDQSRRDDSRQLTGTANFNIKILPGGKKNKAHNVKFGFTYEQQTNRQYIINPFALWQLAERQQDRQLNGIDTTRKLRDTIIGGATSPIYDFLLRDDLASLVDIKFYKSYRDKFYGGNLRTQGNVQGLNPSDLSLDMFSAQELNDADLLSYYGYDYLGNQVASNISFDDFFTAKDAQKIRTFPVAPLQPIYISGYVQDKFTYKDIIFNIGFRVDRFDANTKVLKDPYSLYDIISAKDYYAKVGTPKPANIADDYKVYTNRDRTRIQGFRSGDVWYNESGNPTSPLLLFGEGGKPTPFYARDSFAEIKERAFDTKNSFQDYTPQINFMPRLAFSFPISKGDGENVANFFAHYDILTSRPSVGTAVTALDYYYFDDQGRTSRNNSNLKPERTIDYEVGFQQALSSNSALKLAAFYREFRDMIQRRFYKFLPGQVSEYESFANVDFGTVKGFTAQYEMRGGSNFSANINYTLQFADGTGSDANSQQDINKRQNVRTLSPLSYDERHRFATTFDYRFGKSEGKYQVPKLFGSKFLERFGLNTQIFAVSGRPYTAKSIPRQFGADGITGLLNGSRLPWIFNMDLRIDKTFTLVRGSEAKNRNPLDMTVYFRVQNVLDIRNVTGVYEATGSTSNDGYLASVKGQGDLTNLRSTRPNDVESYLFSYQMREVTAGNLSQPRRMYLGLSFGF
ncbi:MAG: hypothetical protein RL757_639 [Bacteroidota bacterium]|jgi:hypothetical protein